MTLAKSTDIALRMEAGVALTGDALDALANALVTGDEIEFTIQDPEQAAQAITMRILEAETDEEAFSPTGTTNGKELLGIPLEIHPPLRAFPSTLEGEGPKFFVVFDATRLDNGETVSISTGSRNTLAALINGVKRNRFPERTMKFLLADRPTKAGHYPLWLVKADFEREVVEAE